MGLFNLFKCNYQSPDEIWNTVPEEIKKKVDEALAETKKEHYPAAVTIYKKIIADYPDIEVLHNNIGCCLAALDNFDEAETEFIEAIRITRAKRDEGLSVPRSYPREPAHNLIKLCKTVLAKKSAAAGVRRLPENRINGRRGLMETIQRIVGSIQRKGMGAVLKKIPAYLQAGSNPVIRWHDKVCALRAEEFDRNNNITTAGILYQTDLPMDNKNKLHAVYYQGSDSLLFNNAVSSLKINFNDYTFIDFGSGKGKALYLASAFTFKKIIGIEFSQNLTAIARDNIRQLKKNNIETYCMDVVDFKIPEESIVCYFYDPFDEYIMAEVIGNIRKMYTACRKDIVIVYYISRFSDLFDAEAWLERVDHIGPVMIWSSKHNNPGS